MIAGILIGVLGALCLALFLVVLILLKQNKKKDEIIGGMSLGFSEIKELIKNTPRNVIHLDLKSADVKTKLLPLELPIRPENFVVNVVKLKKILLEKLEKENHPDPDTRAYCILDHAGLGSIVESISDLRKPLTIILINEDMDAARKYLITLAESICAGMMVPQVTP